MISFMSKSFVPDILHLNRDSREVGLAHYQIFEARHINYWPDFSDVVVCDDWQSKLSRQYKGFYTYTHPNLDILYITFYHERFKEGVYKQIGDGGDVLRSGRVHHLAFPIHMIAYITLDFPNFNRYLQSNFPYVKDMTLVVRDCDYLIGREGVSFYHMVERIDKLPGLTETGINQSGNPDQFLIVRRVLADLKSEVVGLQHSHGEMLPLTGLKFELGQVIREGIMEE